MHGQSISSHERIPSSVKKLIAVLLGTGGTYADACMKMSLSLQALDSIANSNSSNNLNFIFPFAILPCFSSTFFHTKENLKFLNEIDRLECEKIYRKLWRLVRYESPVILAGLIGALAEWSIIYTAIASSNKSESIFFPAVPATLATFASLQFILLDMQKLIERSKEGFTYSSKEYDQWIEPESKDGSLSGTLKIIGIHILPIVGAFAATALAFNESKELLESVMPNLNPLSNIILSAGLSIIYGVDHLTLFGYETKKRLAHLMATKSFFAQHSKYRSYTYILGLFLLAFAGGVIEVTTKIKATTEFCYDTIWPNSIFSRVFAVLIGLTSFAQYCMVEAPPIVRKRTRTVTVAMPQVDILTGTEEENGVEFKEVDEDEELPKNEWEREYTLKYTVVEFIIDNLRTLLHMAFYFLPIPNWPWVITGLINGGIDVAGWYIGAELLIKGKQISDFEESLSSGEEKRRLKKSSHINENNTSINSTLLSQQQRNDLGYCKTAKDFLVKQQSINRFILMTLMQLVIAIIGKFFETNVAKAKGDDLQFTFIFLTGIASIAFTRIIDEIHKKVGFDYTPGSYSSRSTNDEPKSDSRSFRAVGSEQKSGQRDNQGLALWNDHASGDSDITYFHEDEQNLKSGSKSPPQSRKPSIITITKGDTLPSKSPSIFTIPEASASNSASNSSSSLASFN